MARRVLFLRSKSPAGIEPRLDREARALAGAGYDVRVYLWDRRIEHPRRETRDGYTIERLHRRGSYGGPDLVVKLPLWWLRCFLRIAAERPAIVHAVDFDSAVPAVATKRILGHRLVVDVFDFWSDMIAVPLSTAMRARLARWERRAIRAADLVILVDLARTSQLGPSRPAHVIEVMNVPEDRPAPARKEGTEFLVFYGGMIARDRGLPQLVAACEDSGAKLLVAGHGPDETTLLPVIESSPAAMFLGNLPYEEVLENTANADAIVALYDPAVPGNRLASPNKLFEAMMYSKPVIVSDGTRMAEVVRQEGCGLVVPYGDPEALRAALERLMLSSSEAEAMGARGRAAYDAKYNWAAMERRLLGAYAGL